MRMDGWSCNGLFMLLVLPCCCAMQLALGVKDVHVGTMYAQNTTKCFFITHLDGSVEDFSYLKCLQTLFPGALCMHEAGCSAPSGVCCVRQCEPQGVGCTLMHECRGT
jgi:Protein of unknown function (DUF3223)